MRIVFMGTPDFAVPALKALIASEHEVIGVYTQPDKPKGRKGALQPSPVKETAVEAGLRVYQPVKIRAEESVHELVELNPDLIVVAAFGQIIPKVILDLPKYGCVNLHASLLPKYRGASPIQQAILDGEKESGVTMMRMGMGLDTGDMMTRVIVPIGEEDTGGSLFDKLAEAGADLLIRSIPKIEAGEIEYVPQPEESPTPYAAMITKQMGLLHFEEPAEKLLLRIRAMNPWPSAYTFLNGKSLKIWRAEKAEKNREVPAGTILSADKNGIVVACGEDAICLREIQLEGKKRMETEAFLRGYHVEAGECLKAEK